MRNAYHGLLYLREWFHSLPTVVTVVLFLLWVLHLLALSIYVYIAEMILNEFCCQLMSSSLWTESLSGIWATPLLYVPGSSLFCHYSLLSGCLLPSSEFYVPPLLVSARRWEAPHNKVSHDLSDLLSHKENWLCAADSLILYYADLRFLAVSEWNKGLNLQVKSCVVQNAM